MQSKPEPVTTRRARQGIPSKEDDILEALRLRAVEDLSRIDADSQAAGDLKKDLEKKLQKLKDELAQLRLSATKLEYSKRDKQVQLFTSLSGKIALYTQGKAPVTAEDLSRLNSKYREALLKQLHLQGIPLKGNLDAIEKRHQDMMDVVGIDISQAAAQSSDVIVSLPTTDTRTDGNDALGT